MGIYKKRDEPSYARQSKRRTLSHRRLLALQLTAKGMTMEEIAQRFAITVVSVRRLHSEAITALEADDLQDALKIARKQGLFGPAGFVLALMDLRQRRALLLAANGLTNQMIATRMKISVPAVSQILEGAYRMLGADNRAHAVAIAIRLGIIPQDGIELPTQLKKNLTTPV
jgi:LuxR family transcriptional regulator of spore coat protein